MNSSHFAIAEAAASFGHYCPMPIEDLRRQAPAVFASGAHEKVGRRYTFIPTGRVVSGLMDAGFLPVAARQTRARRGSVEHARHLVRFRRRFETVALRDSVPEIVLLNSHDGTSAYQLRAGLFRLICLNGLMVSIGEIGRVHVAHRGNVVDDVVSAAVQLSEHFVEVARAVAQMEARVLTAEERVDFGRRALSLRFDGVPELGIEPEQVLNPQRLEDTGSDLWRTFNVVQENVLRGGLVRRLPSGRMSRTRAIGAIREDVRLNTRLWEVAASYLAA